MSYTVQKFPDEAIVITTIYEDYASEERKLLSDELQGILENQTDPVSLIFDISEMKLLFQDLLVGIKNSTQGSAAVFRHPMVQQLIVVTERESLVLMARGLNTVTFGNINIEVFPTLEKALQHVRA